MSLFRAVWGYTKIGWLTLIGQTVGLVQWNRAYDRVAATYDHWNERMAVHTQTIVPEAWLEFVQRARQRVRVLDFACGNGTVTRTILERLPNLDLEILGVDLSGAMIEQCRLTILDSRASFVQAEGLAFLRAQPEDQFDAVFCGWGLVYLPKRPVLKEFYRVLVPGGWVGAVMNRSGTLSGVEDAFVDTMVEVPSQIARVMTVRFSLPRNQGVFDLWFRRCGFCKVDGSEGSRTVVKESPADLLDWLEETGALAGCEALFHDPSLARPRLLVHLQRRLAQNDTFQVTHRFVTGHYQKPPRSSE